MTRPTLRTCYVSAPYGKKHYPEGNGEIDFDAIYSRSLRPLLEDLGLNPARGDEFLSTGVIQKSIFEAVLNSDVMVADVTGLNANVVYELGIRHALRRRATLVIFESSTRLPFNMSSVPVVQYELTREGELTGSSCDRLKEYLKRLLSSDHGDSPLFTFFPELNVELPRSPFEKTRERDSDQLRVRIRDASQLSDRDSKLRELAELEDPVLELGSVQFSTDLLLAYRNVAAWDEMINFYDRLPKSVASHGIAPQQVALALSRRDRSGDRQRAIKILQEQIDLGEGSSEVYALLGLIQKRLYAHSSALADLDSAIESYRKGYELDRENYYPGINLAYLLDERTARESGQDDSAELQSLIRQLEQDLKRRLASERASYWDTAALLETLCVLRDWDSAEDLVPVVRARAADQWMLESTHQTLLTIRPRLTQDAARSRLDAILSELHRPVRAEASS